MERLLVSVFGSLNIQLVCSLIISVTLATLSVNSVGVYSLMDFSLQTLQ